MQLLLCIPSWKTGSRDPSTGWSSPSSWVQTSFFWGCVWPGRASVTGLVADVSNPAGFLHTTQLDGSICLPCCSTTFPRAASKTRGWQSREEEEVVAEKWLRGAEPTECHVHHGLPSSVTCGAQMGCVLSPNLPLPAAVGRRNSELGINKGNAVFRAVGCVPGFAKGSWCQRKQPSQLPPPGCLFKPTHCSANWEIGLENTTAAANKNSCSLQPFQEECAPGKGGTLPCWDHPGSWGWWDNGNFTQAMEQGELVLLVSVL